jgi:hypothetical protein
LLGENLEDIDPDDYDSDDSSDESLANSNLDKLLGKWIERGTS